MIDSKSNIMKARDVRDNWRDVLDYVVSGEHVGVTRSGKPIVAIIPWEDFQVVKEDLEDLYDIRSSQKNLAQDAADGDPVSLRVLARDAGFRLVPLTDMDTKVEIAEDIKAGAEIIPAMQGAS